MPMDARSATSSAVGALLEGTGCEALVEGGGSSSTDEPAAPERN